MKTMNTDGNKSILYVTKDIERALGQNPTQKYQILTNTTPYSESIKKIFPEYVHLVNDSEKILSTLELLDTNIANDFPKDRFDLLVFKNSKQIEEKAKKVGWNLLNPSADLAEIVENKLTLPDWLGPDHIALFPQTKILKLSDQPWNDEPFILQWAHGHTGDGTLLIQSKKDLNALKEKFPERIARISDYVRGPSFTVNIVVGSNKIQVGNQSYQITGIDPFTDNHFSTVGNDWSLTHTILTEFNLDQSAEIISKIATKIQTAGWKGLFGVDLIQDAEKNKIYLIEINARQPASTTYESILQQENRIQGLDGYTVFESHLRSLTGQAMEKPIIALNDGAQIVQRLTNNIHSVETETISKLQNLGYTTISYLNQKPNSDLLRIQSPMGIMEAHNKFNKRGKQIIETLTGVTMPE